MLFIFISWSNNQEFIPAKLESNTEPQDGAPHHLIQSQILSQSPKKNEKVDNLIATLRRTALLRYPGWLHHEIQYRDRHW